MKPGRDVWKRIKFQGRTEASIDSLLSDVWYTPGNAHPCTFGGLWEYMQKRLISRRSMFPFEEALVGGI